MSVVDENEFFDAVEGYDSLGDDHSIVWFEDGWISDAESWVDGESRSNSFSRRRRRRASSISDVSSTSDQSAKGRSAPHENTYLNAENLAMLEEDAIEDESVDDTGVELSLIHI